MILNTEKLLTSIKVNKNTKLCNARTRFKKETLLTV